MNVENRYSAESLQSIDVEIIGRGNVGEKASQLIEKTPLLRELGFRTPPRTILAEGFFDGFFQRNELGTTLLDVPQDPQVVDSIRRGSFPEEDFRTIASIVDKYSPNPLAIRSSAAGDSRGTGVYISDFDDPHPRYVRKAVQNVLGSYFSQDAIAFRKDAHTGEGFAIMIEPLVGTLYEDGEYAPLLSGFGYTSTAQNEGYLMVVPGFGGGVDTRGGERVIRSDLEEHDGSFAHYVFTEKYKDLTYKRPRKVSMLRQNEFGRESFDNFYDGKKYLDRLRWGGRERIVESSLYFDDQTMEQFTSLNFFPFFDQLKQLEAKVGKPQYIEWALTVDQGASKIWINQIADVQPKADIFDFGEFGQEVFTAASVIGAGIYKTNNVVFCESVVDIDSLRKFNATNQGYALIYSSNFTSLTGTGNKILYSDINNAAVLIELTHEEHAGHPLSHFGGQLDMTGKLFAVAESRDLPEDLQEGFEVDQETGAFVLKRDVTIIGSERQNRLGIFIQDSASTPTT